MKLDIDHDQTTKESLQSRDSARQKGGSTQGMGIFVVPDPEKGAKQLKGIYVENLEYEECRDRAELCVAFKWVHHSIANLKDLHTEIAQRGLQAICPGGPCRDTTSCGPLCFCGPGPDKRCEFY